MIESYRSSAFVLIRYIFGYSNFDSVGLNPSGALVRLGYRSTVSIDAWLSERTSRLDGIVGQRNGTGTNVTLFHPG